MPMALVPTQMNLAAAIAATFAAACGEGDADATPIDGAAAGIDVRGCPGVWKVAAGVDTSVSVTDGALVLAGTNLAGRDLQITRDAIGGDFQFDFVIEDFMAGGPGAYIWAAISDLATARTLTAGFDSYPVAGVSAGEMPGGQHNLSATRLTTGGVRFTRSGPQVEVVASTGERFTSVAAYDFTTEPVRIWLLLGSNAGSVVPVSTARVVEFIVTAGTGVVGDTFDCDSLIR